MDEASRLIAELQQKLAQLDRRISQYRQDMASEFKKYAEDLLRDVSGDVSESVNKAIAESMKSYPSLNEGNQVAAPLGGAANRDTAGIHADGSFSTSSSTALIPIMPSQGLDSPLQGHRNGHEREYEFQGLFTPSYLPLLDSTDRNERRSGSITLSPASESKAITILSREKLTEFSSPTSSSAPSPSSLLLRNPPTPPRRRNTDEASTNSDQSDTPIRRSALRRIPNSAKQPQSPRHVRFEFAGEEFPTTSSPKFESHVLEHVEKIPIILGNGEDTDYGTSFPQEEEEVPDSPPRKRVSSSEALRLLSRGPVEDDGTRWTEVRAPPDGSASVPKAEGESDDSEDEESLSMRPMSVREAAARSNGYLRRSLSPKFRAAIENYQNPQVSGPQASVDSEMKKDNDLEKLDVAEEEAAIADLAPLQTVEAHVPLNTMSNELPNDYANKSKTVATTPSSKPWFTLADGTNLNDLPESKVKFEANDDIDDDDDDQLFDFDEAVDRPQKHVDAEPDSEPDSPASDPEEQIPGSISKYATSPARSILRPSGSSNPDTSSTAITSNNRSPATAPVPSAPHRASSYHPFNTPIVSEAIHAQAASLGHVQSFVGSVKDGLDEDALQSFRQGAVAGSLRSGVPRSLSEKMAFDDAMEAKAAGERKR